MTGTNATVVRKAFWQRRTLTQTAALATLLLACACNLTAADDAPLYPGLKPDAFMKNWLVLGPIPISDDSSPDEAEQQAAFNEDLLKAAGGEAGAIGKAGTSVAVSGTDYPWRLVQSTDDIIDLQVAKAPEEFSVAYARADASAPIPPPDQITDALLNTLFKSDGPGAAVLVAKNGKILFEKGYGLADMERGVPVEPETTFRIGSITKQFTAAAILKLVEEGKLSVQDTLSRFIPDYPRGEEVTIHHLLTHTSGIRSYTSKPDFIANVTEGVKPEDLIQSFKDDPYDFDPGQKWSYNNSGYFLLGYIIEKVSRQSYGDYLRDTFFKPLGMRGTGVHEATGQMKFEALGYAFEGGGFKKALDWDMSRAGGAGALYSTVGDLYRWNEAVFGGRVLKEATLRTAFTPAKTAEDDAWAPKDMGYGYGWGIQELRGLREISHGGGLQGFVSYLMRLPDEDVTIAVLVNCAPPPPGGGPGDLSHDIAELYLGEKLAPRETPEIDTTVTTEALEATVGRYDYGTGILTVTREGNKVFAQLTGQPKFEIFPSAEAEFFWKVVNARITFVKDENGKATGAIHEQAGRKVDAPRI